MGISTYVGPFRARLSLHKPELITFGYSINIPDSILEIRDRPLSERIRLKKLINKRHAYRVTRVSFTAGTQNTSCIIYIFFFFLKYFLKTVYITTHN